MVSKSLPYLTLPYCDFIPTNHLPVSLGLTLISKRSQNTTKL